jgi:hypothetical protein
MLDAAAAHAAHAAETAATRAFAFVQLASSRLILNQRRQPNEALARRAAAAGRVANALRPKMAPAPPNTTPPHAPPPFAAPLAVEAESALAHAGAAGAVSASTAWAAGAGGPPELVLLLRDSHLRIGSSTGSGEDGEEGADGEEARMAVLEAWLESAGERDAATLRKAFRSFELKQIGTPSEVSVGTN